MISEVSIKAQVVSRADASRKMRLDPKKDISPVVDGLFKYVDYFNSIQEFDSYVFNYNRFDEVMVPNEFIDFVYPKSVKYVPGLRQSTDMLIRTEVPKGSTFTMEEWIDYCTKWRSFFKKDFRTDVTSLATLKVDKSLADVLAKAVYTVDTDKGVDTFVRYEGSPFVPIPLELITMGLYRDDYYNARYDEIVRDYLSTQIYN